MQYIVDPRLIVDVLENDRKWGKRSAELLDAHHNDVLLIAPCSYLALGPAFMGIRTVQDEFLSRLGICVAQKMPQNIMNSAYKAWCGYQKDHPQASAGSVFDSLYIGAFALMYDGILTRQGQLYRTYYKTLRVIEP